MTKRKPQITITEVERLALETAVEELDGLFPYQKKAKATIEHLLDRSKRKDDEFLECSECGKKDETVCIRYCGYSHDVDGINEEECVCDDCEEKHLLEI